MPIKSLPPSSRRVFAGRLGRPEKPFIPPAANDDDPDPRPPSPAAAAKPVAMANEMSPLPIAV